MELSSAYIMYRPLLLSIAYRMLGSASDAEDLVQDTFVQVQKAELGKDAAGNSILNPKAYLCKIVTNRCIDYSRLARKQREVYVGPWLPEPLVEYAEPQAERDPLQTIVLEDTISYALLILMEQLSPIERAVFILREAFSFSYREIADIIGKSELGCRQIQSRIKRKMQAEPDVPLPDTEKATKLVTHFMQAAATGDMQGLISMLAEDVAAYSDGGGKVLAAIRPIYTPERVAAFIQGLSAKIDPKSAVKTVRVNGSPGFVVSSPSGDDHTVLAFHIHNDSIQRIYMLRNPDKLRHLNL